MKTIVTLTRVYKKEVEIEIDNELLIGMDEEQIADYLFDDHEWDNDKEEALFDKAPFQDVSFYEGKIDESVDDDRFDIYQDDKIIYGGHL